MRAKTEADPRQNLATYLAGDERGNVEARGDGLIPAHQDLAANMDSEINGALGALTERASAAVGSI